jgi:hypothetical protein
VRHIISTKTGKVVVEVNESPWVVNVKLMFVNYSLPDSEDPDLLSDGVLKVVDKYKGDFRPVYIRDIVSGRVASVHGPFVSMYKEGPGSRN